MTTRCDFDSEDDIRRNNNVLRIESGIAPAGMVLVRILNKDGDVENESEVDGMELIRAVQNAMNV